MRKQQQNFRQQKVTGQVCIDSVVLRKMNPTRAMKKAKIQQDLLLRISKCSEMGRNRYSGNKSEAKTGLTESPRNNQEMGQALWKNIGSF